MVEDIEKIMDKVRKLLRLTKSTNEHEAALALQRVREIMAKYHLELGDVQEKTEKPEHEKLDQKTKSVSVLHLKICTALDEYYRVRCFRTLSFDGSYIQVAGYKEDILIFKEVVSYVELVFENMFKVFLTSWKETNDVKTRSESVLVRNRYMQGFIRGMVDYLEQCKVEEYALVLVTPEAVIKSVDAVCKGTFSCSAASSKDIVPFIVGMKDGKDCISKKGSLQ
jgi:hypothetical protein